MQPLWARFSHTSLPFFVLVSGLALTCLTSYFAADSVQMGATYRFERLNSEIMDAIKSRLNVDLNGIYQIRGLIQLDPEIDRVAFKTYTDNMGLTSSYPGLMAIGFVQKVNKEDRKKFEHSIQQDYENPSFHIWPQLNLTGALANGSASTAYALRLFEPELVDASKENIAGFELKSDPLRLAALNKAQKTGKAVLTQRIPLLESPTHDKDGYLLVTAVYHPGVSPQEAHTNDHALIGFIAGAFRAEDLFGGIFVAEGTDLEKNHHVSFEIHDPDLDPNDLSEQTRIYSRGHNDGFENATFKKVSSLKIGDRHFVLRVYSLAEFLPRSSRFLASLIFLFGTFLSVLYFYILRKNHEQAEQISKSERQMRLIADSLPVLISYVDRKRKYHFTNRMHRKWFAHGGVDVSQSLGSENFEVVRPFLQRTLSGETVSFDADLEIEGGRLKPTRITMVPDFAKNGWIKGCVCLITDVSERRKQQENYRFLSDLTSLLNASLDVDKILNRCASMIVPTLGDWCMIDFVDEAGQFWHVSSSGSDELKPVLEELQKLEVKLEKGRARSIAMRTGEPYLQSEVTEQQLRDLIADPKEFELLLKLGIRSAMAVPLKARNRLIGAISIVSNQPEREYTESDLAFALDVARRAALAIDNAQLYRETQRASRAKDEFLATLSHELRTPMNVILGWLEIIETENLDREAFLEAMSTLNRNAHVQIQLINDLLDISRIISGKINLKIRRTRLEEAVKTGINSLMPAARAKNIEIKSELLAGETEFMADPDRLQQIIWNLLANAVKFTPEGGAIEARTSLDEHNIYLVIEDTGQGIAPEFIDFIFDRFRQEDGSTTRAQGGLGLGLAIVRYLVELHGGSIVASSPGRNQGSKFTVTFPLRASQAMSAPQTTVVLKEGIDVKSNSLATAWPSSAQPHQELDGLSILLIDDSEDVRTLITRILTRKGARVIALGSAAEGFDQFERAQPNVLLSDIGLPDEDGFSLIRRIRSFEERNDLTRCPAAALTAYAQESDSQQALDAGYDCHLAKPVSSQELVQTILKLSKSELK